MSADFKDTAEWRMGRLGEILEFFSYSSLGVQLIDISDRTHKRAPLLYDAKILASPDTLGHKTADFFIEFKNKSHHQQWKGGSRYDKPQIAARVEEGIDERNWRQYLQAEQDWKKPVALSILSIKEATIIAATLTQLGEPRFSPNGHYKIVNWDIRKFNMIASFDADRLHRFFYGTGPKVTDLHERWLQSMPPSLEVKKVLHWLGTQQQEFQIWRQFLFDQIEQNWHRES